MKKTTRINFLVILNLSFLFFHLVYSAIDNSTYEPADKILLDCGTSSDGQDADGRRWTGEVGSKFATSSANTIISTAQTQDSSLPSSVPYMNARISTSKFTYAFPVSAGRKFVRLFFYPNAYDKFNASNAIFSVSSGPYTLLHNFRASLAAEALNFAYLTREFSINTKAGILNLTFTPSSNYSNAYAFVNGIEVVSMPDIFSVGDDPLIVGVPQLFPIGKTTVLENVIRLNVGGSYISPADDSGLYRAWEDDSPYIYGAAFGVKYSADPNIMIRYPPSVMRYIAPTNVYSTARSMGPDPNVNRNYNLTWILPVDAGFTYLVRLHFCEIKSEIHKVNQRAFNIFINNQTAVNAADVIAWSGNDGDGIPVFKDFVVLYVQKGQTELWVELQPNVPSKSQYYDSILNGLELFKLNDSTGNLAAPNPMPPPKQEVGDPRRVRARPENLKNRTPVVVQSVVHGVAIIALVSLLFAILWRRKQAKDPGASDGPSGWLPLSLYGNSPSAGSAKTEATRSHASAPLKPLLPLLLCRYQSSYQPL